MAAQEGSMRIAAAALALAAACSSDPPPDLVYLPPNGATTVVIEGPGYPPAPAWPPTGAIGFWSTSTWGTRTTFSVGVSLSWIPDMCREIDRNLAHPGTGHVWASVRVTRDDGGTEFPPGTYAIPSPPDPSGIDYTTAELFSYGPLCYRLVDVAGQGTLIIASADTQRVVGSLDVVFTDGTTASGTFEAPVCNAMRSGDLVCEP